MYPLAIVLQVRKEMRQRHVHVLATAVVYDAVGFVLEHVNRVVQHCTLRGGCESYFGLNVPRVVCRMYQMFCRTKSVLQKRNVPFEHGLICKQCMCAGDRVVRGMHHLEEHVGGFPLVTAKCFEHHTDLKVCVRDMVVCLFEEIQPIVGYVPPFPIFQKVHRVVAHHVMHVQHGAYRAVYHHLVLAFPVVDHVHWEVHPSKIAELYVVLLPVAAIDKAGSSNSTAHEAAEHYPAIMNKLLLVIIPTTISQNWDTKALVINDTPSTLLTACHTNDNWVALLDVPTA
eukprot:15064658-Ditylum_brightwellii.AAC.1